MLALNPPILTECFCLGACMQQHSENIHFKVTNSKGTQAHRLTSIPLHGIWLVQQLTAVLKCHSELQQRNSWLVLNSDSPGEKIELLFRVRAF